MNVTQAIVVPHPYPRSLMCTKMISASTALLASLSVLTSVLIRGRCSPSWQLVTNTLFYSTSFTLGSFGARSIHLTSPDQIRRFGHSLASSLLLHNVLTLLAGGQHLICRSQRFMRCFTGDPRSDILLRLFTSTLHLVAGFALNFDETARS